MANSRARSSRGTAISGAAASGFSTGPRLHSGVCACGVLHEAVGRAEATEFSVIVAGSQPQRLATEKPRRARHRLMQQVLEALVSITQTTRCIMTAVTGAVT